MRPMCLPGGALEYDIVYKTQYTMYCDGTREGLSHGHRQHA